MRRPRQILQRWRNDNNEEGYFMSHRPITTQVVHKHKVIFTREGSEAFEKAMLLSLASLNVSNADVYRIDSVDGIKVTGDVWTFANTDTIETFISENDHCFRFYITLRIDDDSPHADISINIPWSQVCSVIYIGDAYRDDYSKENKKR